MATPSDISVGLVHELAITACKAGWEPKDFATLAHSEDKLRELLPFVRGESEVVIQKIKYLALRGWVSLPAVASFDPAAFYQTRAGLYVWKSFSNRILSAAFRVENLPATTIQSYDLVKEKGANYAEIRAELPEGHVFKDASAFCAQLAGRIKRQAGGKEGGLLANGNVNIFCVRGIDEVVFAVSVYWDSDGRRWDVDARPLYDYRWSAGSRVFSATALVA